MPLDLANAAEQIFEEELGGSGGQFWSSTPAGTASYVSGEALPGEPLTVQHSFNLYCGGRPLVVLAILGALENSDVPCGPDATVANLIDGGQPGVDELRLGDLLAHNAGLGHPDLFEFLMAPTRSRSGLLPTLHDIRKLKVSAEYSTVSLMAVLGRVARRVLGVSLTQLVDETARTLGLASTFVRSPTATPIATYVDASEGYAWPLLHEGLPRFRDSPWGEFTGLYTSAQDLGKWLEQVQAATAGDIVKGLPSAGLLQAYGIVDTHSCAGSTTEAYCASFARLSQHNLVNVDPLALGHFGFVRSSLVYWNPRSSTIFVGIVRDLMMNALDRRLGQWNRFVSIIDRNDDALA